MPIYHSFPSRKTYTEVTAPKSIESTNSTTPAYMTAEQCARLFFIVLERVLTNSPDWLLSHKPILLEAHCVCFLNLTVHRFYNIIKKRIKIVCDIRELTLSTFAISLHGECDEIADLNEQLGDADLS